MTPAAAKRLRAIERYSELGAGFQIAMRDLEIRGAGNILGAEQSGHIAAVGYELYCRLLEAAVRRSQGLADLHQLRGRVGRYKHRAYCYLLLPQRRTVSPAAAKRLKTIEEFSDLGAGFQIAMRDLEIRGAGNILGREQSGHITAVGYEMYCQLLDAAVRRQRGEKVEEHPRADVQLELAAFIPNRYVPTESQRIALYRQLQRAATAETLTEVAAEIADMYGPMPEEVRRLVDLEAVRVAAGRLGIRSIHRKGADLAITLADAVLVGPLFGQSVVPEVRDAGVLRVLDPYTVVWRLHEDGGPVRALELLKKVLARPEGGT